MPTTKKASDRLPKNKQSYGQGWGKTKRHDLVTPSGATCEVKRPGINGLIKAGILESLDSLTALVSQEVIPNAEGRPKIDPKVILEDPSKFTDMLEMLDKITLHCVTQPTLLPIPMREVVDPESGEPTGKQEEVPEEEREEGIYIDQVDLEDKTFIMNFVMGGQSDVAGFREESQAALEGVQPREAASE